MGSSHLAGIAMIGALFAVASLEGCTLAVDDDEPVSYVVVRGDTLFLIGRAHGVTVDQLREWNGIEGDRIEVGQVLRIWPGEEALAAPTRSTRPKRAGGAEPTSGTADRPQLELPPEQPCLAGPALAGSADEEMAASAGLSQEQIAGAMRGFVHHTLPCLADTAPSRPLEMEITVACTGRVADVRILDAGDWDDEVARCVTETIRYAPFPAHDLPDGETFRYPLRFTPG